MAGPSDAEVDGLCVSPVVAEFASLKYRSKALKILGVSVKLRFDRVGM